MLLAHQERHEPTRLFECSMTPLQERAKGRGKQKIHTEKQIPAYLYIPVHRYLDFPTGRSSVAVREGPENIESVESQEEKRAFPAKEPLLEPRQNGRGPPFEFPTQVSLLPPTV